MRLKGKTALVTGAAQGFGFGIAETFVREGARDAVLNLATKDKVAFDKIYEGKQGPLVAVDNKAYDPFIELNKFVDALR